MNNSFIDLNRGQRLKEERTRAGFTQKQIAEDIGIREQSWIRYEKKGEPFDLRVVASLTQKGFDMQYVIFGIKNELNPEQTELLRIFNSLNDEAKKKAVDLISVLHN